MIRSVLFDTETTGLEPHLGHRIVEVAALELVNDLPTGRHYRTLIDPCRDIPDDAMRVHGITAADTAGWPRFEDVAQQLLEFFGDGNLIAHNALFDFAFLNAEFALLGLPPLDPARMIDTFSLAKARFPGLPNSLDALCRRFSIDLSARTKHNALLDCRLLADVYIELTGGRQKGFALDIDDEKTVAPVSYVHDGLRIVRPIVPLPEELATHAAFISRLNEPIWLSP